MRAAGPDDLWSLVGGAFPPHQVPFVHPEPDSRDQRRLALVLAYDGTAYGGWQVQPEGPTIQAAVEAALSRLCDHPVRLAASGRTDAGVHAVGQVAAFSTTSRLELDRMARGLAALLPPDIHPRALGAVADDFHPRYHALAKTYDYYLRPGAAAPVFLNRFAWPLREPLDPAALQKALELLPGRRDLAALASRGSEVNGSTVRRILAAELTRFDHGLWRVRVCATGFLRHVMRNLVGTLVQIGRGRLGPRDLMDMLAAGRRIHPGPKAPPAGLFLSRVYYGELPEF